MVKKEVEGLPEKKIKIIADHREVPSGIIDELRGLGVEVESRQLIVGDFILSDRVAVERKTAADFLQSIVDRRLLQQLKVLGETFECPLLILEGRNLFFRRAIHPNAIRGALAAIAVDLGVPILSTKDEKETAQLLLAVAKREQMAENREVAVRGEHKGLTLPESQRFIVEGFPGVSAVLAKRLLEHFGTVEKVMCASDEELRQVHGIGKEKASRIRKVLTATYQPETCQQNPESDQSRP